jgi:hypothetical protein
MERVRLVHWNAEEAEERAARLRSLGFEVDARPLESSTIRELPNQAGAAVVVDLARLPAQGRDIGVAVRRSKTSRRVPLVFVGGASEKVERVREVLPDAVYTSWDEVGDALARAIAAPPADPVVPDSALAGYSQTPLPRKLGIKPGSILALVAAPEGFETTLGELPPGARVRHGGRGRRNLTLAFVRSPAEAERRWDRLAADAAVDDVWIVWAKKASAQYSGVTQANVREPGMARGFVDFKVAAIDETWSGLRFKRRS